MIGQNKSHDLLWPITVAICKNKCISNGELKGILNFIAAKWSFGDDHNHNISYLNNAFRNLRWQRLGHWLSSWRRRSNYIGLIRCFDSPEIITVSRIIRVFIQGLILVNDLQSPPAKKSRWYDFLAYVSDDFETKKKFIIKFKKKSELKKKLSMRFRRF